MNGAPRLGSARLGSAFKRAEGGSGACLALKHERPPPGEEGNPGDGVSLSTPQRVRASALRFCVRGHDAHENQVRVEFNVMMGEAVLAPFCRAIAEGQ